MSDMSNLNGTIFGVYIYNGIRVFRVHCENGQEVYVDDDMKPVIIKDDNDLQTVKVTINGKLVCPWTGHA